MERGSDRGDVLPNSDLEPIRERLLPGLKNRILQVLARIAPGATTTRVRLNRWRGVNIGKDVWIGYDAIIETSCPHLVTIRDRAAIGLRVTILAHFVNNEVSSLKKTLRSDPARSYYQVLPSGGDRSSQQEAWSRNRCLRIQWCKEILRAPSPPSEYR